MKLRMRTRLPIIIASFAIVLAACSPGEGSTTTTVNDDTATTVASGATTPAGPDETSTTAAAMMDGIHTSDTDLGSILVDGEGFTLYVFTSDSDGESTCYSACAELWPPLPGDAAISDDLDGSLFGTISRTDGIEQLTVNGMPLYRYTPDTAPGDLTGQGFGGAWFVVDTAGSMIEAGIGDSAVYDYDY